MSSYDTIRTDAWALSVPTDWTETLQESGTLYFESADGAKAMYVSTWRLGGDNLTSPKAVADHLTAIGLTKLSDMSGYVWKTSPVSALHCEESSIVTVDSYDEGRKYFIAQKVLVRPPIVVRASFHDYASDDYQASREYFAPVIDSLQLPEPAV